MPRPTHKSGEEVNNRSLSKEQICIICFTNTKNLSYSKIANLEMPS